MITKQMEELIEKYKISKTNNIIYGTNIPMPNMVLPTPWKTYIKFDKTEYFFFYFDEAGITLYTTDGESCVSIPWSEVEDFKISHIFIIGKMMIKTNGKTYKFQLNRFVFGCRWIPINTRYLESNNYFYESSK